MKHTFEIQNLSITPTDLNTIHNHYRLLCDKKYIANLDYTYLKNTDKFGGNICLTNDLGMSSKNSFKLYYLNNKLQNGLYNDEFIPSNNSIDTLMESLEKHHANLKDITEKILLIQEYIKSNKDEYLKKIYKDFLKLK